MDPYRPLTEPYAHTATEVLKGMATAGGIGAIAGAAAGQGMRGAGIGAALGAVLGGMAGSQRSHEAKRRLLRQLGLMP